MIGLVMVVQLLLLPPSFKLQLLLIKAVRWVQVVLVDFAPFAGFVGIE